MEFELKLSEIRGFTVGKHLFVTRVTIYNETRCAYLRAPDEHFPPEPYYYDLRGWAVIGEMENLRELRISEICVEDFSFLAQCKNLRTLSLYNTNFTDCRLLKGLPKLKYVDLRSCRLIHKEVLKKLHAECEL